MKGRVTLLVTIVAAFAGEAAEAPGPAPGMSPDEVENQIALDRMANPFYESRLLSPVRDWRDGVVEATGLNLGVDYTALYTGFSESVGEEDRAGSGMVRLYGFWDLAGRDGANKGSVNWKVENRHRYTEIPPTALGFESGYAGLLGAPFSDQGNRLTTFNWKQYFGDGRGVAVAGWLDATDYVDVYLLSSPWLGFVNFAFSTGSAAMDLPNDAALGGAVGGMVTDTVYAQAGVVDANSDPTEPFEAFESVADDGDFFQWVEIGLTPGAESVYVDNIHLTVWHVDERVTDTPEGWGVNVSWQRWIGEKWLPFVRGGYTEESGSLMERSVSAGIGYQPVPMRGVIGAGVHWGRPNPVSFEDGDDQVTFETFWRYQVTEELAVTPTLQYIADPALAPETDGAWAVGVRVRVAL